MSRPHPQSPRDWPLPRLLCFWCFWPVMLLLFEAAPASAEPFSFRNATAGSGLERVLQRDGAWFGAAVAFADLDGDLWPDLYLGGGRQQRDQICINTRDGKFVCRETGDVRSKVALALAVADYDNDGDLDLYVMVGGKNTLLENDGKAQFVDVTDKRNAAGNGSYGPTGTFFDYDGDGKLDLYVGRGDGGLDGLSELPQLLRQGADGTFTDVIGSSGLDVAKNTLAMIAFDYDGDMRQDVFVTANGGVSSLFHNDGGGRFSDVSSMQPAGFQTSVVEGMGIDVADFDGDGDFDIYSANSTNNPANAGSGFFINQGDGTFVSRANEYKVLADFQWGTGWVDFDNDTWPDILTVGNRAPNHFLYKNILGKSFELQALPRPLGGGGDMACVTAAFADYDRDGRVDVILARLDGMPLELLHNETPNPGHWVSIQLAGSAQRDPLGALVEVKAGERTLTRQLLGQTSKGAQNERTLHFGLGETALVDVTVTWPGGATDRLVGVPADAHVSIEEGCSATSFTWPARCNQLIVAAAVAATEPPPGLDPEEGCTFGGRGRDGSLFTAALVLTILASLRSRKKRTAC